MLIENQEADLEDLRKRNMHLEGRRLKIEKNNQRKLHYPQDNNTKEHIEYLHRLVSKDLETNLAKVNIFDH